MIYNISDEPTYGFKRKVEVSSIHIGFLDFADKAVNLYLVVKYYDINNAIITLVPEKRIVLRADNTTWVDQTGTIVPEGDPTAVMTEYDFFMAMMNVPIVISDIIEAKVIWADNLGRFD
jgi:hypothetical protein